MLISFLLFDLPVFAVCGLILYFVPYLIFRVRTGKRPLLRHIVLWVFITYCLSLVYLTLLWYYPDITFRPEWYFLNLRPFIWLSETYEMGAAKMFEQLTLNIGMFLPLGFLLPVTYSRVRAFWKTALVCLGVTLLIETLQYFMGRSADIDDVIMNFAGGMLGYLAYWVSSKLFGRFHWWKQAVGLR